MENNEVNKLFLTVSLFFTLGFKSKDNLIQLNKKYIEQVNKISESICYFCFVRVRDFSLWICATFQGHHLSFTLASFKQYSFYCPKKRREIYQSFTLSLTGLIYISFLIIFVLKKEWGSGLYYLYLSLYSRTLSKYDTPWGRDFIMSETLYRVPLAFLMY